MATATRQIKVENGIVSVTVVLKDVVKSISLHEIAPVGWKIRRGTDNAFTYKESTNEWIWNGTESEMKAQYTLIPMPIENLGNISGTIMQSDGIQIIVEGATTI